MKALIVHFHHYGIPELGSIHGWGRIWSSRVGGRIFVGPVSSVCGFHLKLCTNWPHSKILELSLYISEKMIEIKQNKSKMQWRFIKR